MTTYDWIVIGAGIAGSALGYELAKAGFSTLLIEQYAEPPTGQDIATAASPTGQAIRSYYAKCAKKESISSDRYQQNWKQTLSFKNWTC